LSNLSNIKLIKGVKLNKQQTDTLYFSTILTQETFFISKSDPLFDKSDVSFQRTNGIIEYDRHAEDLKQFNYVMYQTDRNDKWYYAFIDDVKYINDNASQILFTVDYLQTYLFDVELGNSLIEREHVSNDTIGEHTLDENLDVGETVNDSFLFFQPLADLAILLSATSLSDGSFVTASYNGVPSSLLYFGFNLTDTAGVNAKILEYVGTGRLDALKNMYLVPKNLVKSPFVSGALITPSDESPILTSTSDRPTDLDGYTPKNNKLFTYPYTFLKVSNSSGANKVYKYELSGTDGQIDFEAVGDINPNMSVLVYPINYAGGSFPNFDEGLTLANYPQCPFAGSDYQNWLSRTAVSNVATLSSSALAVGIGAVTKNPIAITSGIIGAINTIGQFNERKLTPPVLRGAGSGAVNISRDLPAYPDGTIQTPLYYNMTLKNEKAKEIDEYLTKFGYKVNRLKTPDFNQRQQFTYIKTIENSLSGDVSNVVTDEWDRILKSGVRFWVNNDNIGDYSVSNLPI